MPAGDMVHVILVAAQYDRIATRAQAKMHMRLALIFADHKADNELAAREIKLREAPIPGWSK